MILQITYNPKGVPMSKFSTTSKGRDTIINHEGAKAYRMSPELELYSAVCTASLEPKFYVPKTKDQIARLTELVNKSDPVFVNKLAMYARHEMNMRSVPLVLLTELAKIGQLNSDTVFNVISRADEIVESLSYYQAANDRTGTKKLGKLSKSLQKGIKKVFESGKFNEYHYAKYNRKTDIRLRDALFLTHPKPQNDEQEKLFKAIVSDELATPETWETQLSAAGKTDGDKAVAKKETWERMIMDQKIGYMALLRNLRNILEANVSAETIEMACAFLSNENAVRNSKQFPFRFLSAYKELASNTCQINWTTEETYPGVDSPYTHYVLDALEKAALIAVNNIAMFSLDETVMVTCDTSGSMTLSLSERSKVSFMEIGVLMGMLLQTRCKAVITSVFGTSHKVINLPSTNVLANTINTLGIAGQVGHCTNGHLTIQHLLDTKTKVSKVCMFTDLQLWTSGHNGSNLQREWAQYVKEINPDAKLYLFDLAGYGHAPLKIEGNVHLISGWSEKVFGVLQTLETGGNVLEEIKSYEVPVKE